MEHLFPHIISDPEILGGKPCIAGTRISVALIMEWLGTGGTVDTMLLHLPLSFEKHIFTSINQLPCLS